MSWPEHIILARFAETPAVGTKIQHEGQAFELVDVKPHTRKDGGDSALLTWRSACLDCPTEFETITGLQVQLKRRRCDEHKWRGFPARTPTPAGAAR